MIPLPQPSEVKKIVGSTLPALVTNQPEGFAINFVLTDTLHLAIEPKSNKVAEPASGYTNVTFKKRIWVGQRDKNRT